MPIQSLEAKGIFDHPSISGSVCSHNGETRMRIKITTQQYASINIQNCPECGAMLQNYQGVEEVKPLDQG